MKILNIIKDLANVYNTKKTMKFANETLIREKTKFNIYRRRIKLDFY